MQHHFAGAGCGGGGAAERIEHFLRGAIEVDADANTGRQLYLNFFERLNAADGNLGGGFFFAHDGAANQHRGLDLELAAKTFVIARETDEVDLAAGVFK